MKLPILMYHEINDNNQYSVSPAKFFQQMKYLQEAGIRTVGIRDIPEICNSEEKIVMITFDDGYATDFTEVFPLCNKLGYKTVSFIATAFIGTPGYLTYEQIKELDRQGVEIQSHAHSHKLLATISEKDIQTEFSTSKHILEQTLGKPVIAVSLPGGSMNNRVLECAYKSGYKYIFISFPKVNVSIAPGVLCRYLMKSSTRMNEYSKAVAGVESIYFKSRIAYIAKKAIKNILGANRYLNLWKKLYKNRVSS